LVDYSALMIEAVRSTEVSVCIYLTKRSDFPEHFDFKSYCLENLYSPVQGYCLRSLWVKTRLQCHHTHIILCISAS